MLASECIAFCVLSIFFSFSSRTAVVRQPPYSPDLHQLEGTFRWSTAVDKAFQVLRSRFTSPILQVPDLKCQIVVEVDVLAVGVWGRPFPKVSTPLASSPTTFLLLERNNNIRNWELFLT